MARKFVIGCPVADLRREPIEIASSDFSHQENRESQLLFGENVELMEEKGEWLKIGAVEQPYFTEAKGWQPYPGWVHQSEVSEVPFFPTPQNVVCAPFTTLSGKILPYGTLLGKEGPGIRKINHTLCRATLVSEAKRFLGSPYLWGGRAFPNVDCSGLVNLLYRAQGIILPRNAHDQYLKSQPTLQLQPGDPLYLAKEKRISHVLLKLDGKTLIEAPETGKCVRLLTWGEQIWEKEGKIHIFDRPAAYNAFPSTFILGKERV